MPFQINNMGALNFFYCFANLICVGDKHYVTVLVFDFYIQPTFKFIQKKDLGFKSHLIDLRSLG